MAGTVTMTEEQTHRSIKFIHWTWVSDGSGDADGTDTTEIHNGEILTVLFIPDSGGTQPSNNYDVVINDPSGDDILNGSGANLSNAATVQMAAIVTDGTAGNASRRAIDDKLTLVVSNAGDTKGGQVKLYYR